MSFDDRVLALFADANPVSSEATLEELTRPALTLIKQGEETMSDIKQRPINTDRPIVKQERNRGFVFGLAAAAIVLLIGTVAWIALAGSPDKTLEEAAADGDPVAVIEVFHQKWSEGDVDGALQYVEPPDSPTVRDTLEYVIALEPDGWFWSVRDCAEQVPGTYQCKLSLVGDPVIDAVSPEVRTVQFKVDGSSITGVGLVNYLEVDQLLATYARQQDPDGYAARCEPSGEQPGGPGLSAGVLFNQECGAFMSQFLTPLAAELTAP